MLVNQIVVVILGLLSSLSLTSIIMSLEDNYFGQKAYAHDFSTTDESSLVTLVEQIKAETQLVIANFLSNDNFSSNAILTTSNSSCVNAEILLQSIHCPSVVMELYITIW